MAGRIRIEPYKPLDVHTPPVPGGGYIQVDASAGKFSSSPLAQLGLQVAEGVPAVASEVAQQLARDDEAAVKDADVRLGETEQALLFDPQSGYFNSEGQDALNQAPVVLDTYRQAQEREAEGAANEERRRMLEDLAARRLATFSKQVESHSEAQRQRWHDAESDKRIALMQADAGLNWSDDAILRRALGTARAEVRDKAERNSWPSPLTEATLRQQTSRTLVSAIEAAVERDPERARALRTRYEQHIEASDRAALDALLTEAHTRERAEQASAKILNSRPPDGQALTPLWRMQRAEAIVEPAVRAAVIRTLHSAAAADEARARALGEQVLARVLKQHLTDPTQIPLREWVALDADRRQAIETRLDHNARGDEPAPNPALVDELATQMTRLPDTFERRDLLPLVAQLPLPQWQRFHDLQSGLRRNDRATEQEVYAIKRGLQLSTRMLADTPDEVATAYRAALVMELDAWRRVTGKSPDDSEIDGILLRYVPTALPVSPAPERSPREHPPIHQIQSRPPVRKPGMPSPPPRDLVIPEYSQYEDPLFQELRRRTPVVQIPLAGGSTKQGGGGSKAPATPVTSLTRGGDNGKVLGGASGNSSPKIKSSDVSPIKGKSETFPGTERHHDYVRELWQLRRKYRLLFSKDARKYFDEQTIRVQKGHWDTEHRNYNQRLRDATNAYLKANPQIKVESMTRNQAKDLFEVVVTNSDDPVIRAHLKKMLESCSEVKKLYPLAEDCK